VMSKKVVSFWEENK